MPLPLALLVCLVSPAWWPIVLFALVSRAVAAYTISARVLRGRINWLLLPAEDLMGFFFWICGFFGNTIWWRGRRYRLYSDGRFSPVPSSASDT
jgi:ceramide glucosyltransferase